MIEQWEMQLFATSPTNEELSNQLFPQSLLQSLRWVSREPSWLDLPFLATRQCLVFVWDMTI